MRIAIRRKREHRCKSPRCAVHLRGKNKYCRKCASSRVGFGEFPYRVLNNDELRRVGVLT